MNKKWLVMLFWMGLSVNNYIYFTESTLTNNGFADEDIEIVWEVIEDSCCP